VNDPTTGLPLAGNRISPTLFDLASVKLSSYLPQTSDPCRKVSFGIPVQSDETQLIGRVDWIITSRHSLYGRYFSDSYNLAAFFDPHDILVTSTTGNDEHAQTFVVGDTFIFGPTAVNSLHLTVGRRRNDRGTNPNGINALPWASPSSIKERRISCSCP